MAWIALGIAGLFEVAWAVGLKYAQGFTRPGWSAFTVACMAASFWFLAVALRALPLGTAYAVWTGIGAIGTTLFGMLFLGESHEWLRIVCILLIVAGIVGLKLIS